MRNILFTIIISSIALSPQLSKANDDDKKVTYKTSELSIKREKTTLIPPKAAIATGFADIIEDLLPTVVNISALQNKGAKNSDKSEDEFLSELPLSTIFNDSKKQTEGGNNKKKIFSIGSGFLISKDGLIVTNNHVIEGANEITVSTNDGTKYSAKIIGTDEKSDLALLKIKSDKIFNFAKFGNSDKARIGDWVIIVGNPYSLGGSVSIGIVSARSRNLNNVQSDELIQTDAAINRGNSGGPMFNIDGEVIGISSAIFSPSGGNVGIGFATPSTSAEKIINQLKEKGEVVRGWIGISIQEVSDEIAQAMKIKESKGAFVNEVVKDGPADKAGIMPADIILIFNKQKINQMKDLPKAVNNYPVNETAKIVVWRNGEEKTLKIKVEKFREEEKTSFEIIEKQQIVKSAGRALGLSLAEFSSSLKKDGKDTKISGLVVNEVSIKSQAAKKGILTGDVITIVNQKEVKTLEDLKAQIAKSKNNEDKLFLLIKRGNSNISFILNREE